MRNDVAVAIDELRRQFPEAECAVNEDGQGGAHVFLDPIDIGARYEPERTWVGFHIPAQYPYADIYPVFIGGECRRRDGTAHTAPITNGHTFQGRSAIQVSRRSATAQNSGQKAATKLLKVLAFLRGEP